MGTLPTTGENLDLIGFELEEQPSYTHKLDIEGQRVAGLTDKREFMFHDTTDIDAVLTRPAPRATTCKFWSAARRSSFGPITRWRTSTSPPALPTR